MNLIIYRTTSKQLFKTCCLAITFLITISCSSDDSEDDISGLNCQAGTWTEWVANELNNYYNAVNAYAADPSNLNCATVKSAANDYLEGLRDIVDCVPTANKAAIEQAIDEAEVEVANESCN
ncbi:hypothetical protein [Allomuricauda sp. F6463D]|uniref:hypothetical protein n=1 Tax=Allomuricauda sp. F6463D TaxID=2926409 RepID=UPI001FF0F722|nr:hypothetical protein [Muricauda sp. F6463D]MCK0159983.1 hypothetical protein [Muricauda sp. F6463D]